MSVEEIKRFNEDVVKDEGLQNEIKDVGSDVAKLIEIANGKGYSFTEDDLKAAAEQSQGELSEDQLENVAGGASAPPVLVLIVGPIVPTGPVTGPVVGPVIIV